LEVAMLFPRNARKKALPPLDVSAIKLGTVVYPCPICASSQAIDVYHFTGVEASGTIHIKCQRCEGRWALEADSPENSYILRLLDRSDRA
jgi:hypothetical protein